jgi:prolyl oligopeptidase
MKISGLAALLAAGAPAVALAQSSPVPADPYLWLEDVASPRATAWVAAHNATTETALTADPRYAGIYAEALALAGAKDRIPAPQQLHGQIYNFWTDADHLRGVLRKTTLDDYRQAEPHWTTVLDFDALGKAEGKSWVYRGLTCLEPEQRLCLVGLSDGGEDAEELREFDLGTGQFVAGGFHLPRGKHRVAWEDADHLLIATEWTPGDLTSSGYPYIVKRLARGQALAQAVEVYRGTREDGGYGVSPAVAVDGQNHRLELVERPLDTFHQETWVITAQGPKRLALPLKSAVAGLVAGQVVVQLDEAWTAAGPAFGAGALAALPLASVAAGEVGKPALIWAPSPTEALDGIAATRDHLLVNTLDNVRSVAWSYTPTADGTWTRTRLPLAQDQTVSLGSTSLTSNQAFANASGFLTPSTLMLLDAEQARAEAIKALPAKFDASRDVVEQLSAVSSDGTRVPYFVVHRKDIVYDGSTPTLLYAYGGFAVNMTPSYSSTIGKLWLEQGGAYVLANIRGGGEFGPKWHDAGLGTKRQIIYDDFASVARDLIARKITSARRLGIEGGSNGGLLMGVQFTQHPELWNAVVIQVPLLDMIRISKIAAGASWQGEYGDVNADPAVMAFWLKTSPYHALKPGVAYPEPFIFTTTKDDRVGPQHARKFAARMEEYHLPFYFYENTEGGHGSGADIKQSAKVTALTITYLRKKLFD